MIKNKIYNGYCPLCGEFITTKFGTDNIEVVEHKKFITLYHTRCFEFNFGTPEEWEQDYNEEKEKNENGHF